MTQTEYALTRVQLRDLVDQAYENGELSDEAYENCLEYIEQADVPVNGS